MTQSSLDSIVMSGTPLIGEGNIVDIKSFITLFNQAGIPVFEFYPNGPIVRTSRWFHVRMSMSTKRTMSYAFKSGSQRASIGLLPLNLELGRVLKLARRKCPKASCFITSQNMIAEEASNVMGDIPTFLFSSDVNGKFHYGSIPSRRQTNLIYFVWNTEALDFYKNVLNLPYVYLTKPTHPKDAFPHIQRECLPFQEALTERNMCFIKLSGSGGDPGLVNKAISSLWQSSGTKCIVFPGTEKTRKRLVKRVGPDINVNTNLEPAVFYNHLQRIISHEQMFLTYPSEQVKHIVLLTRNNIIPKVTWLPPRGQHEVMNLAWAIKKGLSGSICIPEDYRKALYDKLIDYGVQSADLEFIQPENLSADHFQSAAVVPEEKSAVPLDHLVRRLLKS